MGGEGSGNWYRFDKKTTTDECHSVDVRYLHREGLLTPGHWFSLRWSRAGRETGSIPCAVIGDEKPERVILTYRHRSGSGGEWEDVREPVPLTWTACNFGGERPWFICPGAGCGRGGNPSWSWALLPVPSLLRPRLREPARKRNVRGTPQSTIHTGEARREHEHDGALSGEA